MSTESLRPSRLVDHHCHGVVASNSDRAVFEDLITEASSPSPPGTSHFETPIGLAVRTWCSPVLDLDPFSSPDEYMARREGLGAEEVNRRFLHASGTDVYILETGYRSSDILDPAAMATLTGRTTYEAVRIETVAEQVLQTFPSTDDYPDVFGSALQEATEHAVGLKTIIAYRFGFAFDPTPPTPQDLTQAVSRHLEAQESGLTRLSDPVLLRFGLWTGLQLARDRGIPLQVHAGYGDPDITLHLVNPSLLTSILRETQDWGVNIVFLHCYPFHREAGYLSAVFPHVYFDIGLALNYSGAASQHILAESLELAPFTKQLYSSDAFGASELFFLGSLFFRRGLQGILDEWIARGDCSAKEADRIGAMIGGENALRIYPIDGRSS